MCINVLIYTLHTGGVTGSIPVAPTIPPKHPFAAEYCLTASFIAYSMRSH